MKINYIGAISLLFLMNCVAASNLTESPVPVYLGPTISTNGERIEIPNSGSFQVNDAFSPLNIGPNRVESRLTKVLTKRANENTAAFHTRKVDVRSLVAMYLIYQYGTAYNLFYFEQGDKQ